MSNDNFEIASGVFICQVCKHYREQDKAICLGCKHLGDFLNIEETKEEEIERKR